MIEIFNIFLSNFEVYHEHIARSIRKKIGARTPDWEDIRGDIYLSLCRVANDPNFRGDCEIGTILYVLIERRLTDYLRFKYKEKMRIETIALNFDEKFAPDPEKIFLFKERKKILRSLIDRLIGWRQRQIANLFLEGHSPVEIGEILKISAVNVRHLLTKAATNIKRISYKGGLN